MQIADLMTHVPVIPVLTIERLEHAEPLARALVDGGLTVLEVTLRTPVALDAIAAMANALPEAIVGAGTVTRSGEFGQARDAGARFIVSPGVSVRLLDAAERTGMPFLPGAVTASEIIMALEADRRHLKFFPAEASGGVATLKSFHGPFPDVCFCPTGGVHADNYLDYLNLPNVLCVGGTWLASADALECGDWDGITALAARIAGGRGKPRPKDAGNDDVQVSPDLGEEDPGSGVDYLR